MKNKVLIIIAIVAIIGFAFTACDNGNNNDNDGGGIPAKFKFANGTAPARSVARAVTDIMRAANIDTASFKPYTDIYENTGLGALGTKVGSSITPTSFKVEIGAVWANGENRNIGGMLVDKYNVVVEFAGSGITLTPGNVNPGTYDLVGVSVHAGIKASSSDGWGGATVESDRKESKVQFAWPDTAGDFATNSQMQRAGATISGNTVTVNLGNLMPRSIKHLIYMGWDENDLFNAMFPLIVFGGDTAKLVEAQRITYNDIISSYPTTLLAENNIVGYTCGAIVNPFTPVTVSDSASAVVIETYWDIDGIIEHYSGPDNTQGGTDDIFVLKNGWWNALTISGYTE